MKYVTKQAISVQPELQVSGTDLKRFLLIFSERIFDSSVDRAIPSLTAAPLGPETRPPVSFRAASIIFFSWTRSLAREFYLGSRFSCHLALLWQPAFVDGENLCFAKDHRTLDDILQFANVSWPRVGLQQFQRLFIDTFLVRFSRIAIDKVFDQ